MTGLEPLSAVVLVASVLVSCGLLSLLAASLWAPRHSPGHVQVPPAAPVLGGRRHGTGLRSQRRTPYTPDAGSGPGRARGQVEPSSLALGRPRRPQRSSCPDLSGRALTPEDRAALELLDHADGGLSRWPVSRVVAMSLRRRNLIVLTDRNRKVVLTPLGRGALADARQEGAGIRAEPAGRGAGGVLVLASEHRRWSAALTSASHDLPSAAVGIARGRHGQGRWP